jgi:methylated-DNA-protein-cysteine methyltransferase-like protein
MRAAYPRAGSITLVTFEDDVLAVLHHLAPGDVVTYGEVAEEAGYPGAARAVGNLLRGSGAEGVPWWRVITASGRLVPGHETEHARRLAAEGVEVSDGRVRRERAGPGSARRSPPTSRSRGR